MLKVGVIGAGHWGPNLINNFHNHQKSEVAWVIDRDPARLERVQLRFPDIKVDAEAETAIGDADVDAVVIATPTSTHHPLVRAALEAGKHVMVEKPITDAVDTANELVALAEKAGRVLMVGHVFVYNAAVQRVKQYLDDDALGRMYYISMVRTNLGPIRVDVNSAWDLASHDISIANYWLDAEPVSVSGIGGAWINPGIEDAVFATLRYPNDVLVNMHVSWLNPRKNRDITLVGERRMLTFDDMSISEPIRVYDKQVAEQTTSPDFVDSFASFRMSVRDGDIAIPKVASGEPLRSECEHFVDCVLSGNAPLTGGREGTAVVRALEAISRSVANGGREEAVTG